MKRLLALALFLACGFAQAQVAQLQAFAPTGKTVTLTANTSGNIPTPVQANTTTGANAQYVLTNIGANVAFVSYDQTSAGATAACVVPTGTATATIPVLAFSQIVITTASNTFFCAITSSGTSVIYVTAGQGQ